MSETDDTDVLLLIPPNFFLVHSSGSEDSLLESSRTVVHKPPSCTAQVLGKLVHQVHSLESRLENLEINSTITDSSLGTPPRRKNWETDSFEVRSLERKFCTFPRRRRRKVRKNKEQELSLNSYDSVSTLRSIPSLRLREFEVVSAESKTIETNESPSMDGDISSIVSTPSKKNDKLLLTEIDEFLTKVEAYESPETKYNNENDEFSPENIIKATGDYISHKLDCKSDDDVKLPSGRIIPSSILDKYIYLVKNSSVNSTENDKQAPSTSNACKQQQSIDSSTHYTSETSKLHGTSKTANEAKSPSARRLNFCENKDIQPTSTPKKPLTSYGDSFKPSSNKIYERASKVLEQYKSNNYQQSNQNYPQTSQNHLQSHKHYPQSNQDHHNSNQNYSQTIQNYLQSNQNNPQSHQNYLQSNQNYLQSSQNLPQSNQNHQQNTQNYNNRAQNDRQNTANYTSNGSSEPSFVMQKEEFKLPQMRPYVADSKDVAKLTSLQNKWLESIDTDLLSLSELWGEKVEGKERGESIKLEEERLKREHCEGLIQQLQKKVLEQQERLAVAMKVDRGKDVAITKLREAWLRLTSSLDRAEERHRSALDKMVREVENFKLAADEAQKKTNHFETELYKALDLAHDYQEKCKQLTVETTQMQETSDKALAAKDDTIESKMKEIELLKENYEAVMRLNRQSSDCVKNVEEALDKEKSSHESSKTRISELTRRVQAMTDENALLKQERDLLKEKVNEERARCNMLERQLADSQEQQGDLLKRCDALDSDVKTLRKHLELQKSELKAHYQKQLEDAVLGKLREFQLQLDAAQRELMSDAGAKQAALSEAHAQQLANLQEQHKLEVSVLEEKQREEIKLYRLQLAQASERIGLLENKIESYRRRRGQIASQLHSVMESQWRQALLILTSNNPPASHLDLTKTDTGVSTPAAQDYTPPKIPPLTMPAFSDKFPLEGLSDTELQHYVKLLLTKPPPLDSGDAVPSLPSRDPHEEPTSDRPDKDRRPHNKRLSSNKPPWKA